MGFWSSNLIYKISGIIFMLVLVGLTATNISYLNGVINGQSSQLSPEHAASIRNFNIVILVIAVIALIILILSLVVPLGMTQQTQTAILNSNPSNFADVRNTVQAAQAAQATRVVSST